MMAAPDAAPNAISTDTWNRGAAAVQLKISAKPDHFIACSNFRASPSKAWICLRSAIASAVNRSCSRAFRFPRAGRTPPHRRACDSAFPPTAGDRHDPPQRILAPQRGLASIGAALCA